MLISNEPNSYANGEMRESAEEKDFFQMIDVRFILLRIIRGWRFIAITSLLFVAIGVIVALQVRGRSYKTNAVVLRNEQAQGFAIGEGQHFELPRLNMDTLTDTIRLSTNLSKIVDRLKIGLDMHEMSDRISLKREINSNLLLVEAIGKDPQEAKAIADTAAEVFVNYLERMRRLDIENAIKRLDALVESAEMNFKRANERMEAFREKHGTLMMDVETKMLLERVNQLKSEIEETRIEIISVGGRLNRVKKGETISASEGNFSGVKRIEEMKEELSRLRVTATEDNPRIQKLNAEMNAAMSRFAEEEARRLQSRLNFLINRRHSLEKQKEEVETKLANLSGFEKEFATIKHDFEFTQGALRDLKARRTEAEAFANDASGEFQLLEKARIPKYPEGSKAKIIAIGLSAFGFLFAFFVTLGLALLDKKFHSAKEISNRFDLPVLGQHLHHPEKTIDPVVELPLMRPVVSSLVVSKVFDNKTLIGFLAPTDESGVTGVVNGLAQVYAEREKMVLVIDLSLGDTPPFQEKEEETERKPFSAVLEEGADKAAASAGKDEKGVFCIDAGFTSSEEFHLFGNAKMRSFLKGLGAHFDFIFIDFPPVFQYIQPLELVSILDGIVVVARSGETKKDHLERVIRQLRDIEAPLLGAFVTDAEPFLAREQEIILAQGYRRTPMGRDIVERILLEKILR